MSKIEDRLAASLRRNAINGNAHDRAVLAEQIAEAVEELRSLRSTAVLDAERARTYERYG